MSWTLGVTDIKTAFKLAPRKETRYLLVTTPPRVLVDCNICDESERWIVLETSPADWADFRDMKVQTFRWTLEGRHFKLMRTAEPNLWRVVSSGDALFTEERTEGFCIDYVDDISAKEDVVRSAMARLQQEWTCSEPEYLSDKGMLTSFLEWKLNRDRKVSSFHKICNGVGEPISGCSQVHVSVPEGGC